MQSLILSDYFFLHASLPHTFNFYVRPSHLQHASRLEPLTLFSLEQDLSPTFLSEEASHNPNPGKSSHKKKNSYTVWFTVSKSFLQPAVFMLFLKVGSEKANEVVEDNQPTEDEYQGK